MSWFVCTSLESEQNFDLTWCNVSTVHAIGVESGDEIFESLLYFHPPSNLNNKCILFSQTAIHFGIDSKGS